MFSRVLVANRGEIAVRVIRALHELDVEAVAIYSTADRDSLHVRLADQAICVGPASATESYLRIPSVIAAAETTGCEAVHPGYGFLAENAAFVEACVDNDLVFVGPPAGVMAALGDKISARRIMGEASRPDGARHRGRDLGRRRAPGSRRDGLSDPAEGQRGRRWQGHAARPGGRGRRGCVRRSRGRGAGCVRRPAALRREGALTREARGDPGALRRARRRPDPRRAGVLDPAAPPEADRRVAVRRADGRSARGDGGCRRARMPRGRVPQRRHFRVSALTRGRLLLHRAERAIAGGAPGDGAGDRDRHRSGAVAHRRR